MRRRIFCISSSVKQILIFFAAVVFIFPSLTLANETEIDHVFYASEGHLKGTVFKLLDADVLRIRELRGIHFFSCVLYGVDAPEISVHRGKSQAYAREARLYLSKQVYGEVVDVELETRKINGRHLCVIRKNGKNINLDMIRNGFAWAYTRYMSNADKSIYLAAEKEARASKLGLWQNARPMPPWKFRHKMKKK